MLERRQAERHPISYYFQVTDAATHEILGSLVNISKKGIMIDGTRPLPLNKIIRVRLNTTPEVADTLNIEFSTCVRWCRQDETAPGIYDMGLEFVKVSPLSAQVLERIAEVYGTKSKSFNF